MSRQNRSSLPLRALAPLGVALACALLPGSLRAQGQAQQHDVTSGTPVTGNPFGTRIPTGQPVPPGLVDRLNTANLCASSHLEAGVLTNGLTGETIPYDVQEFLLRVLVSESTPDSLGAILARGGPEDPGHELADALYGLANDRQTGQLRDAIERFNEVMESRTQRFLEDPSDELLAVHAVLAILSLRGQCRPLERVEVCVLAPENVLTDVEGVIQPMTGDTLVSGRPFGASFDSLPPQYGRAHDWFLQDLPLPFERSQYVKRGPPRAVPPDSLRRVGEYEDVAVFASVEALRPYTEVLVPAGPRCEFQPYTATRPLNVCVVTSGGELDAVPANFLPATGDTLVAGRPFGEVYHAGQPQYAPGRPWFVADEALTFEEREYVQFGVPRVMDASSLRHVGEHDGVPLFAPTEPQAEGDMLFVPMGPGCEFQPYLARAEIRIRG